MTGEVDLAAAWPWLAALGLAMVLRLEGRRGATHLPSGLRHTWVQGLACVLVRALFVLPGFLGGEWFLALVGFIVLGQVWTGWDIMCEDLRHHRDDGRGLFEHETECVMAGGHRDTFLEKRAAHHH